MKAKKNKHYNGIKCFFLFIGLFFLFFLLQPRTALIYYDGSAESLSMTVEEEDTLQLSVSELGSTGIIEMRNDNRYAGVSKDDIFLCLESIADTVDFSSLAGSNFDIKKIFPFSEGNGTLKVTDGATLTVAMPGKQPFTYDVTIEHGEDGPDDIVSQLNKITISNFPEAAVVKLNLEENADISGTRVKPKKNEYRIVNCKEISFFSVPDTESNEKNNAENDVEIEEESDTEIRDIGRMFDIGGHITHFEIKNMERGTLEFNTTSDTQYKDVGHVNIVADATNADSLLCVVEDIRLYPLSVKIEGEVGDMSIAGRNVYVTFPQWITNNITEIILSFIGVMFAFLRESHK